MASVQSSAPNYFVPLKPKLDKYLAPDSAKEPQ